MGSRMGAMGLMRLLPILLILPVLPISAGAPAEYERANEAYAAQNFAEATQLYESIVASGDYSADLFYNLANARYRLGEPGQAILGYERTLALDPGHAEARANLDFIRGQTGSKIPARDWTRYLLPAWSVSAFTLIATIAGWVAVLAVAAWSFRLIARGPGLGITVLAALLCAWSVGGLLLTQGNGDPAIVTAKRATARYAPAETSPAAETLPAGSRVRVLVRRGEWVYCDLPTSGSGWMPAGTIAPVAL